MPGEWELKEQICEVGRLIWQRGYIAANDGNLSVRLNENEVLVTPTLVSKGFMKPEDIITIDLQGRKIKGEKKQSSEIQLHLGIYKNRPDIHGIVHCHPPHAVAFAIARVALPKCILPEMEVFIGEIPIAPYANPGTEDFYQSVHPYVQHHTALILTNHGTVTYGKDIIDAYYKTEQVDQYCRVLLLARQIGEWNQMTFDAMEHIFKVKERLGIPDPRLSEDLKTICRPEIPIRSAEPSPVNPELVDKIVKEIVAKLRNQSS